MFYGTLSFLFNVHHSFPCHFTAATTQRREMPFAFLSSAQRTLQGEHMLPRKGDASEIDPSVNTGQPMLSSSLAMYDTTRNCEYGRHDLQREAQDLLRAMITSSN